MGTPIALKTALFAGLAGMIPAFGAGGNITSWQAYPDKLEITFSTRAGYSYQLQSVPSMPPVYWQDIGQLLRATGSFIRADAPIPETSGFFRVLEFTNGVFWYDWRYYYQKPLLSNWGLGQTQNDYAPNDRPYDWYIDQADTGAHANNNCGPSAVTMAIKWHNRDFDKTAEDARRTYRPDGGWWYTSDITSYLNLYSIPNLTVDYLGEIQFRNLLRMRGSIIILCLDTKHLTRDYEPNHRSGRFYDYASGHFLVVKGWRSTDAGGFLEVYDSNNWHFTYDNGAPRGKNRHYKFEDVEAAVVNWWKYLIVVDAPGVRASQALECIRPVDPSQIVPAWGR